jgi:hypothetical protein
VQAANNQPVVKMVEEDGDYHSNSSSTQLPSQHPFRNRIIGSEGSATGIMVVVLISQQYRLLPFPIVANS